MFFRSRAAVSVVLVWLAACGGARERRVALDTAKPPPPSPPSAQHQEEAPALRLPTDVHPRAERVSLAIDPAQSTFTGVAEIDVHLDRPRAAIWLHGRGLHVTRASIVRGAPIAATWSTASDEGLSSIAVATPLPAGDATLHIEYEAPFMPGDIGLYRVERGEARYAFTQLEEIEARRVFPCFDEPAFKVPFTATLTVPAADVAIANTDEEARTTLPDGRTQIRFRPTPPLPAYLVAFAVGPFDVVNAPLIPPSSIRAQALPLRGVVAKGRGAELAYSLGRARSVIPALEDYFGVAYPFDKLDLVAVPGMGGAMENAATITFAEEDLLIDDAAATLTQKADVSETIAHEIAHQWFGDYVTMPWWDDLWLNEGFATWMASKVMDRIDPAQRVSLLLLGRVDEAMTLDARETARKIRQPIASTDDIENAFDLITYEKGGAVLGMFERWIGEEPFRDGLRAYMKEHRFASATSTDLLAALSSGAKRDVSAPFRTFLDQPGVPFVEAELRCENGRGQAHLRQSRLTSIGSTLDAHAAWQIPICARYGLGGKTREACTLLEAENGDVALEGCADWIFPNADAAGYFRFGLRSDALAKLRAHVSELGTREKMALATSLAAAFRRGSTSAADMFATAGALAGDARPEVVHAAMEPFAEARAWVDGDARSGLAARVRALLGPAARKLGWGRPADDDAARMLRAMVLTSLAEVGRDPEVRAEAKRRVRAFLGLGGDGKMHREKLDANLAKGLVPTALDDGDAATFDALVSLLDRTEDQPTRELLLKALARMRDPALAAKARALTGTEHLRALEPFRMLEAQLKDPAQRSAAWAWLAENADGLFARVHDPFARRRLLRLPGEELCDEAQGAAVDRYLARFTPQVDGGGLEAASSRERLRLCAAQRAKLAGDVRAVFRGK